ncbi:hypothetical protein BGX31_005268, partial [Mortierella sp. GBA43]
MSNGHGNFEPGGMAMASINPLDEAALRTEQYQEHHSRLHEKYRLQHQQQLELLHQTSTHPHDPAPNNGSFYSSPGQPPNHPPTSPCYQARPQYGLSDFELLETL